MSIRVYKRKYKQGTTWTAAVSVRGVTNPKKPHTRGGFATKEQAEQDSWKRVGTAIIIVSHIPP